MSQKKRRIEAVIFDLDDTLWQNEVYYHGAKELFARLLGEFRSEAFARERLDAIEVENIRVYGYGIKSFTLSMIQAALEISEGQISGAKLAQILEAGREMLAQEVELLTQERDSLKSRLSAARSRVDALLERLPDLKSPA